MTRASLAPTWAWLVGYTDDEDLGFLCADHNLAELDGNWHSIRDGQAITVCGHPIADSAPRTRTLYTVCDACGLELARRGRAFHAPWGIVTDVVYAFHRGGPTATLAEATR